MFLCSAISGKEQILHSFFSNLICTTGSSPLSFDLPSLSQHNSLDSFQASLLTHPFDGSEIRLALLGMNPNASPGPDGFGPAFF